MSIADIWASADYTPTAVRLEPAAAVVADAVARCIEAPATVVDIGSGHGQVAEHLEKQGFAVTAVEPVEEMVAIGRRRCPSATWVQATGEDTTLASHCADAVASSFGSMLCDPATGPAEWARILKPGGHLVMSAWGQEGFLATMTDRMMEAMNPGVRHEPPHMAWGKPGVAEERLDPHFTDICVEVHELPWRFSCVEAGMRLYREGSPTHTWSMRMAGARRPHLERALEEHLREHAGPDGRITTTTSYVVISARVR